MQSWKDQAKGRGAVVVRCSETLVSICKTAMRCNTERDNDFFSAVRTSNRTQRQIVCVLTHCTRFHPTYILLIQQKLTTLQMAAFCAVSCSLGEFHRRFITRPP